jgi:chemotaxis protein histidine kinase CheA
MGDAKPRRSPAGFLASFVVDAGDHLEAAKLHLLNLDADLEDEEALHGVAQELQALEHEAGEIGLFHLQALALDIGTLWDTAGEDRSGLQRSGIDLTFEGIEGLGFLLAGVADPLASKGDHPSGRWIRKLRAKIRARARRIRGPSPPRGDRRGRDERGRPRNAEDPDLIRRGRQGGNADETPKTVESRLADFAGEAREHMDAAMHHVLNLEAEFNRHESRLEFCRALHAVRRKARRLGLIQIHLLAHEALTLIEGIPEAECKFSEEVIEISFEVIEAVNRLLANVADSIASRQRIPSEPWIKELVLKIQTLARKEKSSVNAAQRAERS